MSDHDETAEDAVTDPGTGEDEQETLEAVEPVSEALDGPADEGAEVDESPADLESAPAEDGDTAEGDDFPTDADLELPPAGPAEGERCDAHDRPFVFRGNHHPEGVRYSCDNEEGRCRWGAEG